MKWIFVFLALVTSAAAQEQISVPQGGQHMIRLTKVPQTVIVPNESVARVELGGSPQTLIVYARAPGVTTITAQDDKGAVFYTAIVTVADCGFDRIVTVVNKQQELKNKKGGLETTLRPLELNDQHTMRCNKCRCQFFTPRDRPLDEDQVPPGSYQTQ